MKDILKKILSNLPIPFIHLLFWITGDYHLANIIIHSEKSILRGGERNQYIVFEEDINSFAAFNMCFLNDMLGKALLAEYLHAIPVFHVKNINGINLFEEFFIQQDVKEEKCILKERKYKKVKKIISGASFDIVHNINEQKKWNYIYNHNFHLKKEFLDDFEETYRKIRSDSENMFPLLGVEYRGTDYRTLKPEGHPIQPSIDDIITYIYAHDFQDCYFFISTDEENALNVFRKKFGSKTLYIRRNYYDKEFYKKENGYTHVTQIRFDRENDLFRQGYEYLKEIYVLSKCDGIIGSNCGATRMALIMNGGRYMINGIMNLGVYKK